MFMGAVVSYIQLGSTNLGLNELRKFFLAFLHSTFSCPIFNMPEKFWTGVFSVKETPMSCFILCIHLGRVAICDILILEYFSYCFYI